MPFKYGKMGNIGQKISKKLPHPEQTKDDVFPAQFFIICPFNVANVFSSQWSECNRHFSWND
jgi:hypothetical protein